MASFIRLKAVQQRYGVGRSTLYQLIAQGRFPSPVHLGRSALWAVEELDAHDSALVSKERGGNA